MPIGSGTFIPGFEDQLIGVAAGEERLVKVTFPQNYLNAELAGKEAEFDVKVKSIETPKEVTIDDEFAKSLGMESLDKLKDALRDRIKQEHERVTRQRAQARPARRSRRTPSFRIADGAWSIRNSKICGA